MVYIVTNTFVGSGCPKFLQEIGQEVMKIRQYAFDDADKLNRYLKGLEERVKKLAASKKSAVRFSHTATEDGGTVVISKEGMGYTDYIRFSYLVVKGHLYPSLDNLEIRPMDYIKEGGAA